MKERLDISVFTGWRSPRLHEPPRTAIAIATEAVAGNQRTRAVDISMFSSHEQALGDRISTITGLSVTTYEEFIGLPNIVQTLRKADPNTIIVVGGTYPTLYTAETLSLDGIDVVIRGYAEKAWREFTFKALTIDRLSKKNGLKTLQNRLAGYDGIFFSGQIPSNGFTSSPLLSLGKIKQPDYRLLEPNLTSYFSNYPDRSAIGLHHANTGVDVLSGIGCTNRCVFCVLSALRMEQSSAPLVRLRPPRDVVREIENLVSMANVNSLPVFLACPDSFHDVSHLVEILDLIESRHLSEKVSISIDAKVSTLSKAMKQGGKPLLDKLKGKIWRAIIGVESLDPMVQEYVGKKADPKDIIDILRFSYDVGMIPVIQLIFGLPIDSDTTFANTLKSLLEIQKVSPPFVINIHRAIPFPGTLFHSEVVMEGLANNMGRTLSDHTVGKAIVRTKYLTADQVTGWMERTLREFHTVDYLKRASQDPRPGLYRQVIREAHKSGLVNVCT